MDILNKLQDNVFFKKDIFDVCSLYSCYYLCVPDLSSRQPVFNLIDKEVVSRRVKSHILVH